MLLLLCCFVVLAVCLAVPVLVIVMDRVNGLVAVSSCFPPHSCYSCNVLVPMGVVVDVFVVVMLVRVMQ